MFTRWNAVQAASLSGPNVSPGGADPCPSVSSEVEAAGAEAAGPVVIASVSLEVTSEPVDAEGLGSVAELGRLGSVVVSPTAVVGAVLDVGELDEVVLIVALVVALVLETLPGVVDGLGGAGGTAVVDALMADVPRSVSPSPTLQPNEIEANRPVNTGTTRVRSLLMLLVFRRCCTVRQTRTDTQLL